MCICIHVYTYIYIIYIYINVYKLTVYAFSIRNDIDELLRKRLEAKLGRNFEEADALLQELVTLGVQVRFD